jgi:hypothetical protein
MPKSKISSGVISEPPPTPVIPTRKPTQNPEIEYSRSTEPIIAGDFPRYRACEQLR